MRGWAIFAGVLLLALLAAAFAARPPSPLPATAPASAFSAARAFPDVQAIAQRPHPIRSAEQSRVRGYLFGRMTDLGLNTQLRPFESDKGGLYNLVGVLNGADRTQPAVLLMAHYDSVPTGPGAADDGAGVAAVLETVRALETGPRKRDVMVLLTDGEEPGLYGAKAFFASDPLRAHVGVVINLEARGNQGRAAMFETHRQGGALIGALTSAHALSGASSLMPDLYRRLPNDTDLTEALKHGYAGMNFAFFGGLDAYHRPIDTPPNLDKGSLQSIGQQVLAAARALATVPALPARAADQVYADVMGGPILRYPASAGWVLLAVAVAGLVIATTHALVEGETSALGLLGGVGAFVVLLAVLALVLFGDGMARLVLGGHRFSTLVGHSGEALTGAALLAAGVVMAWLWLAGRLLRPSGLWLGALIALTLLTALLQATAPLDAFMLAWPLLLAAIAAVARARFAKHSWAPAPFVLLALAQVFYWAALLFAIQGQLLPAVLAPCAAVAALLIAPLTPRTGRIAALGGPVLAVLGLALSLAAIRP